MKKIAFALVVMVAVSSCNNKEQETATNVKNETSAPLSNEVPGGEEVNMADLANKPLNKGAEKFKGEYVLSDDDGVKALIREHPEKQGLLSLTTYIGNHDPATLDFWYNEEEDILSSKATKGQTTFTTIILDPNEQTIMRVHHDWNRNQSDSTVYKKVK